MQATILSSLNKKTAAKDSATEEVPVAAQPQQQPAKSGFMLWLDENREQLKLDHPEAIEVDLVRLAAQKFRSLPEDERQVWDT